MKTFLAALAVNAFLCFGAYAQNLTQMTATNTVDASGSLLALGEYTFTPTDGHGNLQAFRFPSGGQGTTASISCLVVNGAITTTTTGSPCQLANTALTNPQNLCYQMAITDSSNSGALVRPVDNCVQPTGSTFSLDTFIPNNTTLPIQTLTGGNVTVTPAQVVSALSGQVLTGPLTLAADPSTPLQAATKKYADNASKTPFRLPWRNLSSDGTGGTIDTGTVYASSMLTTSEIKSKANINANRVNSFATGLPVYTAAPSYGDLTFIADFGLTVLYQPAQIPTSDLEGELALFAAHTNAKGEMPNLISQDLSAINYYGSAYTKYAIPDAPYSFPLVMNEIYLRTQSWASVTPYVAALVSSLNAIPLDSTTGCPEIIAGAEGTSYGFQDGVRGTGVDALGCALFANAARFLNGYYAGVGDTTDAATWETKYSTALAAIQGSLFDSTNGMLYAFSGQNHQDSISATAMAQFFGLLTSAQTTAFSTYITANYSTISYRGYFKQSPTNWAYEGVETSTGGPPYACDTAHPGSDCYGAGTYDNGYWDYYVPGIAAAIFNNGAGNFATLAQLFADLSADPDPTMEYWAPGGNPANGATQNEESTGALSYSLGYLFYTFNDAQSFAKQQRIGPGFTFASTDPGVFVSGISGQNPLMYMNRASSSQYLNFIFATGCTIAGTSACISSSGDWDWGQISGNSDIYLHDRGSSLNGAILPRMEFTPAGRDKFQAYTGYTHIFGTGTWTSTAGATETDAIELNNGTTQTPHLKFAYGNNLSMDIDSTPLGSGGFGQCSGQIIRYGINFGETTGAVTECHDITGDFSAKKDIYSGTGFVVPDTANGHTYRIVVTNGAVAVQQVN